MAVTRWRAKNIYLFVVVLWRNETYKADRRDGIHRPSYLPNMSTIEYPPRYPENSNMRCAIAAPPAPAEIHAQLIQMVYTMLHIWRPIRSMLPLDDL